MIRIIRNLALASVLPLVLSACGGGGGSSVGTAAPITPTASYESRFGAAFATFFDASNTTDPQPAAGGVPALSLTAEPLDN